jgi:hypothetical protein
VTAPRAGSFVAARPDGTFAIAGDPSGELVLVDGDGVATRTPGFVPTAQQKANANRDHKRLIERPAERAERGRAGQECVRAHQGATERTAEALLSMLAGIRRA